MLSRKDIPKYEGLYEADESGKVFSKDRIDSLGRYWPALELRQISNADYLYVCLYKDGVGKRFASHRIIAGLFIPNPKNKRCVNHKNGIKWDNRSINLEWNTHSENNIHAFATGLHKSKKGKDHKRSIPVSQYDLTGKFIKNFAGIKEAARELKIGNGGISNCVNGVTKISCGFIFKKQGGILLPE